MLLVATSLLQTKEALDAAEQLYGPAGLLIAVLVIAIISYLAWLSRSQYKRVSEIQERRIEDAQNYAKELREIERDVLQSLNDVVAMMDKADAVDRQTHEKIGEMKDSLSSEHSNIVDEIRQ